MKLLFHYSAQYFSNTYVIGPDEGGASVIIDPGTLDVPLLEAIEENNLYIRWVLITRCQPQHIGGLRTLLKIYDSKIYSRQNSVAECPCQVVKPGTRLILGDMKIDVLCFPEYTHDAVSYKLGEWLFCGDLISAGRPGKTTNPYSKANLYQALEKRFFQGHDDLFIFPGEGPPSLMRSERLFNRARIIQEREIPKNGILPENPEEMGL